MNLTVAKRTIELPAERRQQILSNVFARRRTARARRTLRIGSPGGWKSGASEVEACEWWLTPFERQGLLFIDPHGDTVESLSRRFFAAGRGARTVLDELDQQKAVPGYLQYNPVPMEGFAAEVEVHNEVMRQVEILADERGHMERINLHPFVRQWLYWPIRALIRDREPLRQVREMYQVLGERSRALVQQSNDQAVHVAFSELCALPRMEIERQVGAARRIMESYVVPQIRERSGSWPWLGFLEDGGALLIDGGNVAQEVMRPFCLNLVLRAMIYARLKRIPLLIIIDEFNRGFASHMMADQIEQMSKFLMGLTACVQAPDFPKEIAARFWQSFQRTELFGSSAEVLKDMLHHLWPLINFHREHHRDVSWQQFHAGFDEIERDKVSHSVGKQHHGGEHPYSSDTESTTTSTDVILRPRYREFATERISYWRSEDQLINEAVNVMQQAPGDRLVLENGRAYWDSVPWLNSPFPCAFERTYEKRYQEFLCEMRERPYFRTPQTVEEPIRLGAACRLQKLQAELNGHSNGSNGAHRS